MKNNNFQTFQKRLETTPCPIGKQSLCCKLCLMGPCRVVKDESVGACGATMDLIVARNILRFIAAGAATHCGHALHTARHMEKELPENYIKKKAPDYLYSSWEQMGILPSQKSGGHFIDISEALHMTTMGVNADTLSVLANSLKMALIDGYYGLYLATELEDSKIGKPTIKNASVNLNCIDNTKVNIAIHGHEPLLAMSIVNETKNHHDINLVGVCCTGSTILAQAGIPLSAHFALQEDVLMSGVIDALVVDVHCIMPSVGKLCDCYHTKLITTNELGRFANAIHKPIENEQQAKIVAKEIIEIARANKKNRNPLTEKIFPENKKTTTPVSVGFTEENIDIEYIAKQLACNKKKGIIAVLGCVNPRAKDGWVECYQKLAKDYIILTTGCMAFEFGKDGLLDGKNLFHLGSCVNNSRIAEIFRLVSQRLNKKISELNFVVSAPMPITEKSGAIGIFFAILGCDVHIGYPHFFNSNQLVTKLLQKTLKNNFESKLIFDQHPDHFFNSMLPSTNSTFLSL